MKMYKITEQVNLKDTKTQFRDTNGPDSTKSLDSLGALKMFA